MARIFGKNRYAVTVAAFGDVSKPFGEGAAWPDEWEKPYRDRPKVEMTATGDTTLGHVLRQAMVTLNVQPPPWGDAFPLGLPFVAFYKPEDETGFSTPFQSSLALLDKQGRVTFRNYNFDEINFDQLLQASRATVLEGDPLRPYLILHHEVGNGVLADWGTLVNFWDLAWHVLNYIDTHLETLLELGGGVYAVKRGVLDRLRGRTRAGRDVAARRSRQWTQEQGANPPEIAAFLAQVPRSTEQVAGLLGCSTDEAEAVLWAFGLGQDAESGLWIPAPDEEAKMLRGNVELVIHAYGTEELEKRFHERARHLLEHGETPPVWPDDPEAT